mgnify:CR=1 FL=1
MLADKGGVLCKVIVCRIFRKALLANGGEGLKIVVPRDFAQEQQVFG